MKTTYDLAVVRDFLIDNEQADPNSIKQLVEGQIAQTVSYEDTVGSKHVLRIADYQAAFQADAYAAQHFGAELLVPQVTAIGKFYEGAYYCISQFVVGKTVSSLHAHEMVTALPQIQDALAKIYTWDISATTGYGSFYKTNGMGQKNSWRAAIGDEIEQKGVQAFKQHARHINLEPSLIDDFFCQYKDNVGAASEVRRLCHGDPAFDNMLIDDKRITAMIDWPQMGYGDWMSDVARLDFWAPGQYGDAALFADTYGLEADNMQERKALYWATNALWAIEFADKAKSPSVRQWLQENVADRRI